MPRGGPICFALSLIYVGLFGRRKASDLDYMLRRQGILHLKSYSSLKNRGLPTTPINKKLHRN